MVRGQKLSLDADQVTPVSSMKGDVGFSKATMKWETGWSVILNMTDSFAGESSFDVWPHANNSDGSGLVVRQLTNGGTHAVKLTANGTLRQWNRNAEPGDPPNKGGGTSYYKLGASGNLYWIIKILDGAQKRFLYVQLDGGGTPAWTHATTEPN